jgi:hypothetical protein
MRGRKPMIIGFRAMLESLVFGRCRRPGDALQIESRRTVRRHHQLYGRIIPSRGILSNFSPYRTKIKRVETFAGLSNILDVGWYDGDEEDEDVHFMDPTQNNQVQRNMCVENSVGCEDESEALEMKRMLPRGMKEAVIPRIMKL